MSTDKARSPCRDAPLHDSEVIAVREYVIAGTTPHDLVLVHREKPTVRDSDGKYECGSEISEGGRIRVRRVLGNDEFDALQVALALIENDQLFPQQSYLVWDGGTRRDLI